MSSLVRSSVLGRWTTTAASQTHSLVVCPAGMTLIVKSIAVQNRGTATSTVAVYVQNPSGTVIVELIRQDIIATGTQNWTGWVAMQPGDTLLIFSAVSGTAVWASGTVLSGTSPITPTLLGELELPEVQPTTTP